MSSLTENDPAKQEQLSLPFGPIRNSEFLSNHWLEHRLPLEPEWQALQDRAILAGRQPADLTFKRLKRSSDLPVSWAEQREFLGFSA